MLDLMHFRAIDAAQFAATHAGNLLQGHLPRA